MTDDVLPRAPMARSPRWVMAWLAPLGAAPVVALAWWFLAPLPRLQRDPAGVMVVGANSETSIAADGVFAACAAIAGLTCALLVFLTSREPGLRVVLGLSAAGVVGAIAAWRLGVYLGPPPVEEQVRAVPVGQRFSGPLELSALGVLLVWPLVSVTAYSSLVAGLVPAGPPAAPGRRRRR